MKLGGSQPIVWLIARRENKALSANLFCLWLFVTRNVSKTAKKYQ
jgi:hypothetical protein